MSAWPELERSSDDVAAVQAGAASVSVQHWSESDFAGARTAWTALLASSDADPLFASWEWQYTWWKTFAESLALELVLLAAHDEQRKLVGIAPLFRRRVKLKELLPIDRIELMGNCWSGPATMRTQHAGFIVDRARAERVVMAFLDHLHHRGDWHQAVLSDLKTTDPLYRALEQGESFRRMYVRCEPNAVSYYIDTTGSFSEYLASRGKNTRLQMYNRRQYLARLGKVEIQTYCGDPDRFFTELNDLHALRWGQSAFTGRALAFNRQLASLLGPNNKTHFSVMSLNGKPLSMLYNYRVGGEEYYIQGGFDEQFDKKLALGFLHLGFAIEQAFENPAINRFNLLPGGGKNSPYKSRLASTFDPMAEVQLIRGAGAKLAYRLYDFVLKKTDRQGKHADE